MAEEKSAAPRLSRHRTAFVKNRVKRNAQKEHGYDARNYHENANRHGIHCLTKFNCPICHCKNTVRVDLNTTEHMALVKCTYCLSLKPRPPDLPYPYATPYVPKLENRADAFFRFSESYRTLVEQQAPQASREESSTHDATGLFGDIRDVLQDHGSGSDDADEAEGGLQEEEERQNESSQQSKPAVAKAEEENKDADEVDDVAAFFASDDD